MNEQQFLGVGWDLSLSVDDNHQVKLARYEESIRQSIWMILSTSPGERIMRPTFGSNLQALVFETNDAALAGSVVSAVRSALKRWEPRIRLLDINAFADADKLNVLHINISYEIRATNSRKNLVYPFYLEHA